MKARETIYYGISGTAGKLLDWAWCQQLLEWFVTWLPISPGQPKSPFVWIRNNWWKIWLVTTGLLLGVNGAMAVLRGRFFWDHDEATRQFLEDGSNLINYTLICPAYVVLGLALILHIGTLRVRLTASGLWPALGFTPAEQMNSTWRLAGLVLTLFFSILSISEFAGELRQYRALFWFQDKVGEEHVIGTAGFYYVITNFVLNLIAVLVIVAQFEVFAVASRIGSGLRRVAETKADLPASLADKKARIHALRPYVEIYVISKLLVVVFLANMYTWRAQQPDFAGMVALTSILVAVLGTAVVSYPRYHVQYWLFRVESRDVTAEYPDIRATMAAGLASLTDLLILGTAMTNLVLNVIQGAGIHVKWF